jgi:dihydrofolate reductase
MIENDPPMRKVIVYMNMTLDGVIQGPARHDEDLRDGFPYGGWGVPYEAMQSKEALSALPEIGPLLLGRWTYEDLYTYWTKQVNNPFTDRLNQMEKYVVSNTLHEPLPWVNSVLIHGDVVDAVSKIKAQPGKDIMVMGSGELIKTLLTYHLVDLYVLLIHPIVLGTGRRLFPEGLPHTWFKLVDAKSTSNGVVVEIYRPEIDRDKSFRQVIDD